MPDITPQSPLLQPIEWQGQLYFTSHYFHRTYVANSRTTQHAKVKYQWHQDFIRLLKSMEAYDIYCEQGDIITLTWISKREEGSQNTAYLLQIKQLEHVFKAVGYQALYLMNATAQVAMSHHLDDELSRQLSAAANTTVARQMTRRAATSLLPDEHATRSLAALLEAGRLLGTPTHIAQQEAIKMVEASTGVNLRPLLIAAPAQSTIAPDEEMLEPADLAKRLGFPHGAYVNQALEHVGWQVKQIGGGWTPTPAGTPYASRHAWTAKQGTKSGYNWKWQCHAVEQILHAHGIVPPAQGA